MQVAHYHLQSSHSDIHTVFDPHSKVEKILKSFALETAKSKERFLKESAVSIVLCTKSIDIYTAENCFIHDNIGYLTYPKINKMKPITHYRLPEQKLKTIFKTLCKAVRECHKHGIAHRDIRTTNILYDIENDAIKLKGFENADFWGLSKKLSGAFGRKFYSAPETFTQHSYDGEKLICGVLVLFYMNFLLVNSLFLQIIIKITLMEMFNFVLIINFLILVYFC